MGHHSGLRCGLMALLCLSLPLGTSGQQQQKEWTWKDRDGNVRSRADLDKILEQHKLWLDSHFRHGFRAELSGSDLRGAALGHAILRGADLRSAYLMGAILTGANLREADLSDAILIETDLSDARLTRADLKEAVFEPKDAPTSESIALAHGLELMKYERYPRPLTQLRELFQGVGYREAERAITCALNR